MVIKTININNLIIKINNIKTVPHRPMIYLVRNKNRGDFNEHTQVLKFKVAAF